jgi:1-acyl-sn-glycerol-3-phosphate acyltransferase
MFWIIMIKHFFQTLNIILKSIYSVIKMSIETVRLSQKNQLTHQWVDQRIQSWSKEIIGYTKANWQVINPNNIAPKPGQPTIIMCNHASLYDIPFTYLAFPNETIRMLAKTELSKLPFFGKALKAAGIPFINRQNRQQAIEDLNRVRSMLAEDLVLWIAPEGTRSADGHLGPFKKGGFITAIQAQATIIPMIINGANKILPARSLSFSFHQKVDIIIGQPIDASEYALTQKDELMRLVRNTMKSMLDEDQA